ncbi:aldo/keto reductase [Streptomyces sp. NPDC005065]|uniref:aldo/keto reductase n=1 Tax=Streptomyces sp. NPDC005065 TaxID=3154461 RepID=UPI0033B3E2DB
MTASPLPQRRLIGKWDEHPLGVGCWPVGGLASNLNLPMGWAPVEENAAVDGLLKAHAMGATVFDTADVYGLGHSQRLLKKMLAQVPRDSVRITSKIGYFRGTGPNAYTPLNVHHQVQQSLENLGTDYLDVLSLHNTDFGPRDDYLEDALETLRALRRLGTIKAIGMRGPHRLASDRYSLDQADRENKRDRFVYLFDRVKPEVVFTRYSPITPDVTLGEEDEDILSFAARRGVATVIYKPLVHGLLTGKYDPDAPPVFGAGDIRSRKSWFTQPALAVIHRGLQPLRERFGPSAQDLAGVALRYCLQRCPDSIVLTGFTSPDQIEANYAAVNEPLTPQDSAFARETYEALRTELDGLGEFVLDETSAKVDL